MYLSALFVSFSILVLWLNPSFFLMGFGMEEEKDTESHSVCYAVPIKIEEVQIIDVMGPSFPWIIEVFDNLKDMKAGFL